MEMVCILSVGVNLCLLGMTLKLYTEIMKQWNQKR